MAVNPRKSGVQLGGSRKTIKDLQSQMKRGRFTSRPNVACPNRPVALHLLYMRISALFLITMPPTRAGVLHGSIDGDFISASGLGVRLFIYRVRI